MKYGFIGCGNMGGALAEAVAKKAGGADIMLADSFAEKRDALAQKLGAAISDNNGIANTADFIFLGVKPQVLRDMLRGIAPVLAARKSHFTLVSMAAGIQIAVIQEALGFDCPIIRIMPNTPVSVGEGMILYTANALVSGETLSHFANALSQGGRTDMLDEKLIDAASALSGCGPAFVCMFVEALADGAVECGLPREKALLYAAQTLKGTAELLIESGKHPGALKDAVCSPGGSTICGVHALEKGGFRASCVDAVTAAYKKTRELGN